MSAHPSSPNRVRQRRNPASLDLSSASPNNFSGSAYAQSPPYSPQTPRTSVPQSPMTHRRQISSTGTAERPSRFSGDFASELHNDMGACDAGGLGSLADELANAWDDGYGYGYGEENMNGEVMVSIDGVGSPGPVDENMVESIHDMGIGMGGGMSQGNSDSEHDQLKPPLQKLKAQSRHRRQESLYDGSEYGNDSDFEEAGDLPPALEARLAGIDNLVRWSKGEEANDEAVDRFIGVLRQLGGQTGIENSTSRLITAHTSLSSHLTHQTRSLQTLTHPLLISSFPTLSSDAIDDLVPLIDSVIPNLPFPDRHNDSNSTTASKSNRSRSHSNATPLLSIQSLLSQTSDLTHTLRTLNDTLHESRQLTSTASRRLKTVRELVIEMRRDDEAREEGIRWIEKGGWDTRLAEREAGTLCQSVVSGFEDVCGEWRDKLFGSVAPTTPTTEVTVT